MYFEARHDEIDGWRVVSVVGEIDLATVPEFRSAVMRAAAEAQARPGGGLAVDLTHCGFVDSLGLGVVLGGSRRMRAAGGCFAVICPDERLRVLFELTRLDEIVDLVTERSALGTLEPSGRAGA